MYMEAIQGVRTLQSSPCDLLIVSLGSIDRSRSEGDVLSS